MNRCRDEITAINESTLIVKRPKLSHRMLLRSGQPKAKVSLCLLMLGKALGSGRTRAASLVCQRRLVEVKGRVMRRSGGVAGDLNSRPPFLRFLLFTSSSLGSLLSKHIQ